MGAKVSVRAVVGLVVGLVSSACSDGTGPGGARTLAPGTYYLYARHNDVAPDEPTYYAAYSGTITVTAATTERIEGSYSLLLQHSPRFGTPPGDGYQGALSPGNRVGQAYRVVIGGRYQLELHLTAQGDRSALACTGTASLYRENAPRVPVPVTECILRTEPL